MLIDIAFPRNDSLWFKMLDFGQLLDEFAKAGRAKLLELRELIHNIVLKILSFPDTVFLENIIHQEGCIDEIWDAQDDRRMPRRCIRSYLVDYVIFERIVYLSVILCLFLIVALLTSLILGVNRVDRA